MLNRDFFAGLIGFGIAVAYYGMAARIPVSQLSDDVGPEGLPKIYAWIMGGLSLLLMARALALRTAAAGAASAVSEGFALRRAAGIFIIAVAYVLGVPFLGYPLSIAVVVAIAAAYQGGRISAQLAAVSIGGAAVLWFVFVFMLHIAQPAGIWPDLIERFVK